ncbi:uncharacterized protein EI97DRAFT_435716 [Westerdykella ornata]|uniref:Uncharacterized protein n=1 Tax=Westerdykella ornata TaxID=318751 RepID=A0A6A6JC51_WESOR|nr:uncharacterized protein EI97DRAFT_435716 [Westerdykella ornata]KAF2273794.1 hypothetical protein EI97DRAFT_435716 [Westerdykella ornata]
MTSSVLASRDANTQIKPSPSPEKTDKDMPKSLEYHRQMLQSRLNDNEVPQYVSPSDEIMSPASQKLNAFRTKHAMKKSKPQTLFKKTSTKNFETASKGGAMFADIPKAAPEEKDEDAEMAGQWRDY